MGVSDEKRNQIQSDSKSRKSGLSAFQNATRNTKKRLAKKSSLGHLSFSSSLHISQESGKTDLS